jgi:hypothetical protein
LLSGVEQRDGMQDLETEEVSGSWLLQLT